LLFREICSAKFTKLFLLSLIIHFSDVFNIGIWKELDAVQVHPELKTSHQNLKHLCQKSKAKNTVKSYESSFKQFCKWCKCYDFEAVPTSDYTVALYLSHSEPNIRSDSKLNSILYGISYAHKQSGFKDPCDSMLVKNVKEGILRSVGKKHTAKLPLTKKDIDNIIKTFGKDDCLINKRFVAMSVTCFYGFLRFNEVVSLKRSDLDFSDNSIVVNLRRSKTDQYKKGDNVVIAKTEPEELCPVHCIKAYLTAASIPGGSSDFLFRNVYMSKKSNSYQLRKGNHMSYTRAREIFLSKLEVMGYDSRKYGLHSFRSGGATAAAAAGVSERLIKKHGRWRSDICKDMYIHENESNRLSVSLKIAV